MLLSPSERAEAARICADMQPIIERLKQDFQKMADAKRDFERAFGLPSSTTPEGENRP